MLVIQKLILILNYLCIQWLYLNIKQLTNSIIKGVIFLIKNVYVKSLLPEGASNSLEELVLV